jgi:hypothetical protein
MRVTAVLLAFAFVASASAEPRITAHVSQQDVRAIYAAIRAVTHEPIVAIRATYSATHERTDRVGVQTGSDRTSAGGQYLLERVGTTWKILGQSRWTHATRYPDAAAKRWPLRLRPSELSEADVHEINALVAKETHDEIRAIKVTRTTPRLLVQVHTASPHIVTEGEFTVEKVGAQWHLTKKG